jgi:glycogen(starch) synthase
MKVVISSYTFLPDIGGVATTVSILAAGFYEAGHDVTVVTLTPGGDDGEFPYRVVRRPSPWKLHTLYRQSEILILSNLSLQLCYPLILSQRRFALHHHSESAWSLTASRLGVDIIRRHVRDKATHFMTSAYCGKMSKLPHEVIYPFANPNYINNNSIQDPGRRDGILFVGRLTEEKGVLYLLDRIEVVRSHLGNMTLTVIGDGPLINEVRQRVSGGQIKDVEVRGPLSLSETANEMGRAVYSIVPSIWNEPFGAVSLESLSAGCVTIHSSRGGLPETSGTLGFSFDPDDEGEFIQALRTARRKKDHIYADRQAWRNYMDDVGVWKNKFSPDNVVATIVRAMTN